MRYFFYSLNLRAFPHPTQRAATVLEVKAVAVFYAVGKEKELGVEGLLVAHHGIEDGEELAHTGSKGYLLLFASFQ